MIKSRIATLILLALFVSSCQRAPKIVTDAVIANIESSGFCQHLGTGWDGECSEFKVVRTVSNPLTDADKANGIDEKWCVQIDYIRKPINIDKWEQLTKVTFVIISGDQVEFPTQYFLDDDWDLCLEQ